MAAFTSKATGNWSAAGQTTWNEVGVPVAGDTVTIAVGHVITVDDTSRACAAITLNGTLSASRTASCKLAYSGTITINSTGHLDWGTEASPIPAAYTATLNPASGIGITFNNSSYGGKMTVRGDSGRKAWTTVATASLSAPTVVSATGWQPLDELLFVPASSTNNNANHIEIVELAAGYTPENTTLTFTTNLTQTHIAGGRVCNLTRNCVLEPSSGTSGPIAIRFDADVNAALSTYLRWARFKNMGNSAGSGGISYASGQVNVSTIAEFDSARIFDDVDSCVFYRTSGNGVPHIYGILNRQKLYVTDSVFIDTSTGGDGALMTILNHIEFDGCTFAPGDSFAYVNPTPLTANNCWFAGRGQASYFLYAGVSGRGANVTNSVFSGAWAALFRTGTDGIYEDNSCDYGSTFGLYLHYKIIQNNLESGAVTNYTGTNSKYNTYADSFDENNFLKSSSISRARLWNKNDNTATQEYYTPQCRFSRETSTVKNAPSSLKAEILTTDNLAQSYTFQILAKNGETLQLRGYLNKNADYGSSTRPSVTVSGLGVTAVAPSGSTTYTMTDVTDWELFNLYFSQSSGADGLLDVTFTVQSSSATAIAYLGGIAISPFVTRTRHYGYQVLETSPTVLVDSAIDTSISEATAAAAYTGIGITWGSSSSIATSADTTFKKLVHYTSATMDTNVASALPITWAGAYNSPAIFAQGAIDISGYKLNGSGSLSMGALTLTATTPFSYTYTGGTFSQATTIPTFSGGTLNIGAAGTYTYTQAASTTVSATPTGASNYVLSGGTFTGTLTFHNTTAHNITVEVPSGTTTSSAGSPGAGTVTFVSPQIYQSVVITGFTAGSRIYLYDTGTADELLFNGTASAGDTVISGTTCTWTDSVAATNDRTIFIRVAYVDGVTAKEFIEVANIGTCGTTDGTKTVSYIATQSADAVYDANGENGSTIYGAGEITFTDAGTDIINMNMAAGTISLQKQYAAWVYYAFTSAGIATDIDYIRAIDTANYEYTGMVWKNTSSPTAPLKVTGGYAWDSTTLDPMDLIDTTGGTIFLAPAHVVAYATGSGVTAQDITDIAAEVLTAAASTPIRSDVRKVVGITVDGTGTDGDPWGPV